VPIVPEGLQGTQGSTPLGDPVHALVLLPTGHQHAAGPLGGIAAIEPTLSSTLPIVGDVRTMLLEIADQLVQLVHFARLFPQASQAGDRGSSCLDGSRTEGCCVSPRMGSSPAVSAAVLYPSTFAC